MELRKATEHDDLRSLWALCFPEDDGARYFEREYRPCDALIYEDGGTVRAMLHILPRSLRLFGKSVPAGYIFAVGTHPENRGQGLAGDLVEQALFELHLRGVPLAMLLPCSEGVQALYRKYGFVRVGHRVLLETVHDGRPATEKDIPALSALYDAAYPCRAERTAGDWAEILFEYDVKIYGGGYRVYDGRGVLEQIPEPPEAPPHPLAAMLKVSDKRPLYALAEGAGLELSRCGPSAYCPWDNGSAVYGAPPPEGIFFENRMPYVNLLHN